MSSTSGNASAPSVKKESEMHKFKPKRNPNSILKGKKLSVRIQVWSVPEVRTTIVINIWKQRVLPKVVGKVARTTNKISPTVYNCQFMNGNSSEN
jgi:hypothetical protein